MSKREMIVSYNVLSALVALVIMAGEVFYFFASKVYLATRPCVFEYALNTVSPLCTAAFLIAVALPVQHKVNAKGFRAEKCIEVLLLLSLCANIINTFFSFRLEYSINGIPYPDWEKLQLMLFYALLFGFLKTNRFIYRVGAVIAGAGFIVYECLLFFVVRNDVMNISVMALILSVAMWIITLCMFLSLKRAVFAAPSNRKISTNSYVIDCFVTASGERFAIMISRFHLFYTLYSYSTGSKMLVDGYHEITVFEDSVSNEQLRKKLRAIRHEEYDAVHWI